MTQILSFSLMVWILLDRFKKAWEKCSFGSYITSAAALILGACVAIYYQLDIVVALELAEEISPIGIALTALAIMGGSSCIAEIIAAIKDPFKSGYMAVNLTDLIGSDEDDDEEVEEYDE